MEIVLRWIRRLSNLCFFFVLINVGVENVFLRYFMIWEFGCLVNNIRDLLCFFIIFFMMVSFFFSIFFYKVFDFCLLYIVEVRFRCLMLVNLILGF